MVSAVNRTLKSVYDEIIMRLGRHRNQTNTDWATLVMFINRSIKEILVKTLPYKEYAYVNIMAVANNTILPINYLKQRRCMLSYDGNPPYTEARYVDTREFFGLDNWRSQHAWNLSTRLNPVYTLWGGMTGGVSTPRQCIYMSPNTLNQTGVAPTGYTYSTINVSGLFEYYAMPPNLTTNGDVIPIPYEYEELLILSTLARMYYKTAEYSELQSIWKQLQSEEQKVGLSYQEKKRTEVRELEEYVEPVIPVVQLQPAQGEFGSQK